MSHPVPIPPPVDCIVVGAGLSGLCTARGLARAGVDFAVLEARGRVGGRILSRAARSNPQARYDLGPAWVWPSFQPLATALLAELGIPLFAQATAGAGLYEDDGQPAPLRIDGQSPHGESRRIAGGASTLVEALATELPPKTLHLEHTVTHIEAHPKGVALDVRTPEGPRTWQARHVVLALPPRLAVTEIAFDPPLAGDIRTRLAAIPTWMAAHAKLIALYEQPFWRNHGLSGEVFSRRGPLTEIYDASPADGGPYALFGFYGLPAAARRALGRDTLIQRGIDQIARLFGTQAGDPIECMLQDWSTSLRTATRMDEIPPSGHPQYGFNDIGRSQWDGRLLFAGTESAARNGGYLEGAVEAAMETLELIAKPDRIR
ncbi:hypothetical protein BJI67_01665 [Acidihalobacter aeolianus]|uniref:Amine oxidase domain-containing protein n=1 Tax=Acidihalobacter aeolianus TaxID=2792603 RepID=A0A1D8K4S4_9GAMM|nr:FAD-dependent oxidoreductase [Acidihalobacter aeolianus]AOV15952.1 hypothetical protein BJI67_01665 [Acidihalobacter aeolianus]